MNYYEIIKKIIQLYINVMSKFYKNTNKEDDSGYLLIFND